MTALPLPAEALERFGQCMDAALAAREPEPTAMTLATVDNSGQVTARMVLLKSWDAQGFVFYTNTLSRKGRQLAEHPRAALVMYWKSIEQQVRVEGAVEPVSAEEADAYFASRDRGSQLGAWASMQSEPLDNRAQLLKAVAAIELKRVGRSVARPPHWSGYRVQAERIEFWYGRKSRLHDRFQFHIENDRWVRQRLYP